MFSCFSVEPTTQMCSHPTAYWGRAFTSQPCRAHVADLLLVQFPLLVVEGKWGSSAVVEAAEANHLLVSSLHEVNSGFVLWGQSTQHETHYWELNSLENVWKSSYIKNIFWLYESNSVKSDIYYVISTAQPDYSHFWRWNINQHLVSIYFITFILLYKQQVSVETLNYVETESLLITHYRRESDLLSTVNTTNSHPLLLRGERMLLQTDVLLLHTLQTELQDTNTAGSDDAKYRHVSCSLWRTEQGLNKELYLRCLLELIRLKVVTTRWRPISKHSWK